MYLTLGDSMQSEITRRGLMKTAALLPLAGARGTAANPALTVGLIGSGGRGRPSSGTSRMGRRSTPACGRPRVLSRPSWAAWPSTRNARLRGKR